MHDPETGNVICFNGEIYNFAALRKELEADGAVFRSDSDTEVLLRGYAVWGREVLTRLRGMFAFALWDARERRALLARDRLGIKPLYLAQVERPGGRRAMLFASEVRSLLATGLVERRMSESGLASYLWNGFVAGPHSIVHGVWQLAPDTAPGWTPRAIWARRSPSGNFPSNTSRTTPKRVWKRRSARRWRSGS